MYDFTCLWLWSPSAWSGCWLHPAEFHCAGLEQIISWLLPKAGLLGCDLWPRLSLHALWGRCSWTLGPGGPLNFEAHRFPCQPLIRATSNKLFDKHRKTVNCQLKWEKWNKYHAHILYTFSETLWGDIDKHIAENNRQKMLLIYVASKSALHIDSFYTFKLWNLA